MHCSLLQYSSLPKKHLQTQKHISMASSSSSSHHSNDSPRFCLRIVNDEDLKNGKKEIPKIAVRKYRDRMTDHIFLKVPNNGDPWKIKLRESPDHGKLLAEGLEEFTSFYLLEQGDFIVLNFEGEHSHFHAHIFDSDDMEIDHYPIPGAEARAFYLSSDSSTDEYQGAGTITISSGSSTGQ